MWNWSWEGFEIGTSYKWKNLEFEHYVVWVPPKAFPDTKICVCVYLRDDLGGQEWGSRKNEIGKEKKEKHKDDGWAAGLNSTEISQEAPKHPKKNASQNCLHNGLQAGVFIY